MIKSEIRLRKSKIGNGPIAQSRLERTPDKREVVGSIPTRPTTPNSDCGIWISELKKIKIRNLQSQIRNRFGGCSSVGRAPALHAGGHRFDPVHLHQIIAQS